MCATGFFSRQRPVRMLVAILAALVVNLVVGATALASDPTLVGWWKLDETSGTMAADSSGKGNNGTVNGTATWVAGTINGALQFDGSSTWVDCGNDASLNLTDAVTIVAWIKPNFTGADKKIAGDQDNVGGGYKMGVYSNNMVEFEIRTAANATSSNRAATGGTALQQGVWYHVAGEYVQGQYYRTYINGNLDRETTTTLTAGTSTVNFKLGRETYGTGSLYWQGALDDVAVFNRALTADEIKKVMKGVASKNAAAVVSPADKATDVPRDATLSWTAGQYPATHDVYLGTVAADVNNASRTNKGLLVSQGQADTSFDPAGVFAYGQTYYWRIDEVNKSADGTINKGDVWSFTAEPYGYPITSITATASSSAASMGPEKTIDGSGLTGDLHGTEGTTMWLSGGAK
ncbi:MAG: LamG domain-containing protein, partial [Phycisphaerae bacterium]|nr:LamG domain-containing protein [Phycisphaerae bacterium]